MGTTLRAQLRGTRCYVEFRQLGKGRLFFLSASCGMATLDRRLREYRSYHRMPNACMFSLRPTRADLGMMSTLSAKKEGV